MKTSKWIISTLAILIFFMAQSFALPKDKTKASTKETQIKQYINNAIAYPDFAKTSGLQGFVLVEYQITQKGNIKIDAINGSNQQLINYVQNQLSKLNIPLGESKNQYARFIFKQS